MTQNSAPATPNPAPNAEAQPVFSVEKLYVKDLSLEVPHAPEIFLEQTAPEVSIQISNDGKAVETGIYESVLTVTVTAKIGDKIVFLVEVGQAGIFRIAHVPQDQIDPIMAIACPNLLYPYLREVVSDATTRAGFAPVILQPVNFEALYMQRLEEAAKQEKTKP